MKIVCPHTGAPHPETLLSLAATDYKIEHRYTAGDTGYAELVMQLWRAGEGFTIIEQDVAFQSEQLQTMLECERDYCAGVYEWTTNIGPALGFTKFGDELLNEVPVPTLNGVSFRQLDVILMRHILGRKYQRQPHLHLPPVKHCNPKQKLRPEFQHFTLAEHLGALGYEIADDGQTADYMHATVEFGDIGVRA